MTKILLTCEHGGNEVPKELLSRFKNQTELLASHRGFDEYALKIAKTLATSLKTQLYYSETSRLVVDLNRSIGHPKLFSEITRDLTRQEQATLIKRFHEPVRKKAFDYVKAHSPIHHYSIHSFVPVLHGHRRKNDIGILFDPARPNELKLAKEFRRLLKQHFSTERIYFNLPYRGNCDGHTTQLRKTFKNSEYVGIEIEFNQAWLLRQTKKRSLTSSVHRFADVITSLALNLQM